MFTDRQQRYDALHHEQHYKKTKRAASPSAIEWRLSHTPSAKELAMKRRVYKTNLPYCVQQLPKGRIILLNRLYKPLGLDTAEQIEYESHPSVMQLDITEKQARAISWEGVPFNDEGQIFLYKTGNRPENSEAEMAAYLKRLQVLMLLRPT
jgi:hypothetical protein